MESVPDSTGTGNALKVGGGDPEYFAFGILGIEPQLRAIHHIGEVELPDRGVHVKSLRHDRSADHDPGPRHAGHPNLLPAWFENDPAAGALGASYVRKPLFSREGANIELISAGTALVHEDGPYGREGYVRQGLAPLPNFAGQYPVIGSWIVGDTPCGLSIREDENPITGNGSRFIPHAIV